MASGSPPDQSEASRRATSGTRWSPTRLGAFAWQARMWPRPAGLSTRCFGATTSLEPTGPRPVQVRLIDFVSALNSIAAEILADTKRIGDTGAAALEQPSGRPIEMLTLDSTGALSGGLGTAFAMIRAMAKQGRDMHVWILETRPFHSGSRLGALELAALGIPATLVVDAASASILSTGPIDAVLAGADLIAADGSAVGVVGTAGVATLAQAAGVPFWILASTKSIDLRVPTGVVLSVDQGSYSAVTPMMHEPWQPGGSVASRGPLQDVTSPDLIGAIVTEMGIAGQPLERGIIHAIGGKR